jgi:hypothetical protein
MENNAAYYLIKSSCKDLFNQTRFYREFQEYIEYLNIALQMQAGNDYDPSIVQTLNAFNEYALRLHRLDDLEVKILFGGFNTSRFGVEELAKNTQIKKDIEREQSLHAPEALLRSFFYALVKSAWLLHPQSRADFFDEKLDDYLKHLGWCEEWGELSKVCSDGYALEVLREKLACAFGLREEMNAGYEHIDPDCGQSPAP